MDYLHLYQSPLGGMTLASNGEALTGLWFDGQKYFASTLRSEYEVRELPVFKQAVEWLDIYFSGHIPEFIPPLHLRLTPFRQAVCQIMLGIPYGQTMTYGAIANKMAEFMGIEHMSGQAVGNAVGHNPISLIIPCHRVIGANGCLTGYAGGLDKKSALLKLEGARM